MGNTPYGLSALMETINNVEKEEEILDEINDVAAGTTEGMSFLEAEEAGLVNEDGDDTDDGEAADGMEDFIDEDDPEMEKLLDKIPEDEEDEIDMESFDVAVEAYIEKI